MAAKYKSSFPIDAVTSVPTSVDNRATGRRKSPLELECLFWNKGETSWYSISSLLLASHYMQSIVFDLTQFSP